MESTDMGQMTPCVPLPLEKKHFQELVAKAKDWALMHGAAMRSKTNFSLDSLTFAPFTLIPSTFPRKEFEKAVGIQTILNELIHKVAHDKEFLTETLYSTVQVDDFARRLFQVYETVQAEGQAQGISVGLFRSDYLLDQFDKTSIKQVEFNTISVSFGGVGTQVSYLHRYVLGELGRNNLLKYIFKQICIEDSLPQSPLRMQTVDTLEKCRVNFKSLIRGQQPENMHNLKLPENNALTGLCKGLVEAWKIYGKPKTAILFIVEDVSYNICDQRFHEFEVRKMNPEITVIRRTLTEVFERGHMTEKKQLIVDDMEIAVVYFRCGYAPSQFSSENEWAALLLMERSLAIKCPSVHYHLAGTKKVQQALARPNVLEKFLKDPKKVEIVREIFTDIYSLEFDEFGNEAVKLALRNPEKYVLKPQREGGGNNIYGPDVRRKMEEMINSQERTAWILMARIMPPIQKTYIIRPGIEAKYDEMQEVVSELGIFGVIIGDSEKIFVNHQFGHMLRTKLSTADEGGVAAGVGCLDSPLLID